MAESKLKIDIRRNAILELLRGEGKSSVTKMSQILGVTPVTVRNDLAALERDGYLIRTHGWAALSQQSRDPEAKEDFFQEKQALAARTAALVQDGQTLFLNSGTTTRHIAQALRGEKYLNIVTNSLNVAMELGNIPTFHILLLGGEVEARFGFTYGGDTQDQISKYKADWAILSVDGVSAAGGITTYHPEEAIIDRMMIANARRLMVTATANKIGNAGFSRICACNSQLTLITEQRSDPEAVAALEAQGVAIQLV